MGVVSVIGLDIGSHSIKLVEIAHTKPNPVLISAGTIPTPPKALVSSLAPDHAAVSAAIRKLHKEANSRSRLVSVALPESQVFTRVIKVPKLSEKELTSAIRWEAEQYIPLPLDQVNLDFSVLREHSGTEQDKMEVLLVAAPKALLQRYVDFVENAGLTVESVETEIISISRSLIRSATTVKTAMVVSLGAQTTDLSIMRSGVISYTRSISSGGEALSRALVSRLGFQQNQAEEFKKTYGLDRSKLEGKIVEAVKPIMDTIIGELKRALAFYQERYKDERIEVILLSGGTARIPGMVVYIAETMGIEVQLANPWIGLSMDQRFAVLNNEGPTFAVSVGLALRG